jgi:acetyl-CoA carboxylase, biotin carboxylase subunit
LNIRRVLIANRGEIAVRIIRTCRQLGIETVLAVSQADRNSVPARLADRAFCIGPPQASASYLKVEALLQAATGVHADAIHPGYGFLSENGRFARQCEEAGIVFIGPTAEQIAGVGDKLEARRRAETAGVPLVPGGRIGTLAEARIVAERIGWPVLIKAVAGGGGRGMKRVDRPTELAPMIELAAAEAVAAFGDPGLYLERFVTSGRHVEVQLLGDGQNVIHVGDRDCSVQRRYQKLVEEGPAPNLSLPMRTAIHAAALRFGGALNYRSAGTVEFLADCERDEFYFLEMNARIQVEHPVTETLSGLDLVAEQIAIAEGHPLRFRQEDVSIQGHAIECRINAEDPSRDFRPAPGKIAAAKFPSGPGIRVDTHIEAGANVPPYYDSLIAKVIAYGGDRKESLHRLRSALGTLHIDGVATNRDLHLAILDHPAFIAGGVDTNFIAGLLKPKSSTPEAEVAYGAH